MAAALGEARISRFAGLGLIVVLIVLFGTLTPETFLTWSSARSIVQAQAITIILSLSLLITLSAGAFDISVGQNMGLGGILCLVLIAQHGWNPWAASLLTIAVCMTVGALNAFLVVGLGLDSFIATLGVGSILLGVAAILSNNVFVGPPTPEFQEIARWSPFGIPVLIIYALILAAIVWYVLEHSAIGRRLYAVGANPDAARLAGINVKRYVSGAFIASGFGCGLAAILLSASLGSLSTSVGGSYLLPVFAGCFLAATQIKPGRYNVGGLLVALFLLGIGVKGFSLLGGASWIPDIFNGVALIAAVALAVQLQRRQEKRSRRRAIALSTGASQSESVERTGP